MEEKISSHMKPKFSEGDEVIITKGIMWGKSLAGQRGFVKKVDPNDEFPYTVDIGRGFCIHVVENVLIPAPVE